MVFKKNILIDLDGVLNQYNGKYDENKIPPIKNGAKEFIEKLYNSDYELYLFTSRNKLLASKWLIDNNLDKYFKDVTDVKISAYLYIDDRNIVFNGDFEKIIKDIDSFKVWWKK